MYAAAELNFRLHVPCWWHFLSSLTNLCNICCLVHHANNWWYILIFESLTGLTGLGGSWFSFHCRGRMKDYRSCLLNIAMSERADCSFTLPSDAAGWWHWWEGQAGWPCGFLSSKSLFLLMDCPCFPFQDLCHKQPVWILCYFHTRAASWLPKKLFSLSPGQDL